jgi:hypothetical protein
LDLFDLTGFYEPSNEPFASSVVDRVDRLADLRRLSEKGPIASAPFLGPERRVHHHRGYVSEGNRCGVSSHKLDVDAETVGVLFCNLEGGSIQLDANGSSSQKGGPYGEDAGPAAEIADGAE